MLVVFATLRPDFMSQTGLINSIPLVKRTNARGDKLSCCLESLGPQISHVSSGDRVGKHCTEKVKVLHLAHTSFCCCEGLLLNDNPQSGCETVRICVLLKEPRSWTPSRYRQLAVLLTSVPSGSSQVFVNMSQGSGKRI